LFEQSNENQNNRNDDAEYGGPGGAVGLYRHSGPAELDGVIAARSAPQLSCRDLGSSARRGDAHL